MKNAWKWVLPALMLVACDKQKTPISGTRVAVVNYESSLQADDEAKATVVSLPSPDAKLNWTQTGSQSSHVLSNSALNSTPLRHWKASIGSGNGDGRLLSSPIVYECTVYALDTSGVVSAFHTETGNLLWQTNISPEEKTDSIIGGGVAYGDERVYVTSPYAQVLALDAKTGKILWKKNTQSPVRAAPTYDEGRLYVLTISNQLDVYEGKCGDLLWSHAGITEHAGLLGTASPAVSKGVVIVTYSSGEICALKAENGYQLWSETLTSTRRPDSLSSLSHIKALPIIDQGRVIIVGHNQKMAAYDLRRGERIWERSIGGTRTPAVLGGYIFMVNSHNELLCLTRDYGQVVWIKKLPCDPENPTKVIWEGPIVADNKLYLVSTLGRLAAYNPRNGNSLSEQNVGSSLSLAPLVAQGTLYILTDEGDLLAFK